MCGGVVLCVVGWCCVRWDGVVCGGVGKKKDVASLCSRVIGQRTFFKVQCFALAAWGLFSTGFLIPLGRATEG